MVEIVAAESIVKEEPSFAQLVAPVRNTFGELATHAASAARNNLEYYLTDELKGHLHEPLAATLNVTKNVQDQTLTFEASFTGAMPAEQYQALQQRMTDALLHHPVLGKQEKLQVTCQHLENGQVCLKAAVPGLNAQDYAELISALAEQQHKHDTFESTNGFAPAESHFTHEKIQHVLTNLKELVRNDPENSNLPDFKLTSMEVCRSDKDPSKFRLDFRIDGVERTQYGPIQGALIKAFKQKRRRGMPSSSGFHTDDLNDGYTIGDTTVGIDDLDMHHLREMVDKLAEPFTSMLPKSIMRFGKVHDGGFDMGLPQN